MKRTIIFIAFTLVSSVIVVLAQELKSPNGKLSLQFALQDNGVPAYSLTYKGKDVIKTSKLGLELKGESRAGSFDTYIFSQEVANEPKTSLYNGFEVVDCKTAVDQTWQPVWGEEREIRDNYNELAVTLN